MSEDFDTFVNTWGDKIELHKFFIKMEIINKSKQNYLMDFVPNHPTGTFRFEYSKLDLNDLVFSRSGYKPLKNPVGKTFGYIEIETTKFYFNSNNTGWLEVCNLIRDKCSWTNTNNEERAKEREKAKDYVAAIDIWEKLGRIEEAARVRKLLAEMGSVKVSQKVVHGDDITKTEIKDSVVTKSNVGSGGKSKAEKIKEIKELLDSGAIDADDYEKMKREIIG